MHSGESLIPFSFQEAVQINPRLEAGIFKVMKRRRRKKVKDFFFLFETTETYLAQKELNMEMCLKQLHIFHIFIHLLFY